MRELIDKAVDIIEEHHSKREQIGLDYNVFTLMDIERREEETHEYMIYSILNYRNPDLRKEFIEQFLISMGIDTKNDHSGKKYFRNLEEHQ